MKLGDLVTCSAYIKRSKNHYIIGQDSCEYLENGAYVDGIEIEDFHSCERFKTIEAVFSGIYVGATTLCTHLNAEYYDNSWGQTGFRCFVDNPQKFAIVYYADNKKRLVPIDQIKENNQ